MTDVDVQAVLRGLKGFQRDAVDHLIDQFYPEHGVPASRRFLVADETGLGKSIVARGAIARAIDGARLVLFDGMGHDLPQQLWDRVIGVLAGNFAEAG